MEKTVLQSSPFSSPPSSIHSPPPSAFVNHLSPPAPTSPQSQTKPPTTPSSSATMATSPATITSASKKHARSEAEEPEQTRTKKGRRGPKKPVVPPTISRPSRNRRAPERLVEQQVSAPEKTPSRKPANTVLKPDFILANPRSRLAKADVYHFLLRDEQWTCLTSQQRIEILSLLPQTTANVALRDAIAANVDGTSSLERPREFGANFDLFRTDVAKFQEDLRSGYFGKRWQEDAGRAVAERAEGKFDEWKEKEAERWWGQGGQ